MNAMNVRQATVKQREREREEARNKEGECGEQKEK